MNVTQLERRYYDLNGAAEQFSCSRRWLEDRVAEGMPHFMGAGRIKLRLDECEDWLIENGHWERRA